MYVDIDMRILLTKVVFALTEGGARTLYSRRTANVMVKARDTRRILISIAVVTLKRTEKKRFLSSRFSLLIEIANSHFRRCVAFKNFVINFYFVSLRER